MSVLSWFNSNSFLTIFLLLCQVLYLQRKKQLFCFCCPRFSTSRHRLCVEAGPHSLGDNILSLAAL